MQNIVKMQHDYVQIRDTLDVLKSASKGRNTDPCVQMRKAVAARYKV
jgi:hypothetical protein